MAARFWVLIIHAMLTCCAITTRGNDASDAHILLSFRDSLSNHTALSNWNPSVSFCSGNTSNWDGLLCSNNVFYGLQLEGMGLMGTVNMDTIAKLRTLRTISLMNNSLHGPMPRVNKMGGLRGLFLSNNRFSGDISDNAFSGMNSLKKVYLSNNDFKGRIPKSLAKLPKLLDLWLENNQFEGSIPGFKQKDLRVVNLANNKLEGPIPARLSTMDSTFFAGNSLCGKPFEACKPSKKQTFSKLAIIAVVLGVVALVGACVACYMVLGRRGRTEASHLGQPQINKAFKGYADEGQLRAAEPHKNNESSQLYFVRSDRERFELEDLLRASAEVLGSGIFGSSYKAMLISGASMVVKRFRQMNNAGREEFHEHMRRLGRLSHPNLLPLVAFYYKKEEKLLITDFVENGSLASHLHGKRSPGEAGLDWATRLKIIKGVANGLAYLYKELPSLTLPHGHLKSSNVLLDSKFEALVGEYALSPMVNRDHSRQCMVAYKSPEFTQSDRTTKKTDVWSLGILILEALTGEFPGNYLKQGKKASGDLGSWVKSVVREEWTGEVFDKSMKRTRQAEGEMLKLLKIGMCCCEREVEKRWDLKEAVEKIQELRERDSDEDCFYSSEGEAYSSRAVTDEDFSFSVAA